MIQFDKKAYEEYFRSHDFSNLLAPGITLSSVDLRMTIKKSGGDVTSEMVPIVTISEDGKKVLYKIRGGKFGQTYLITIRVTDSYNQKWEDTLQCQVF